MPLKISKNTNYIYILIHVVGWICFYLFPIVSDPRINNNYLNEIFTRLPFFSLIIIFFYINYLFLIPRLFFKKHFIPYLIIAILFLIGFSLIGHEFISQNPPPMGVEHQGFHNEEMRPMKDFKFREVSFFLIILIISTTLKMTTEWFKNERQKTELEKEKLNTELAFLKSQINPHFFFNVLNNICSLARKKSDKTEDAIIKLSQLMRYNFYDFKNDKVPLSKELDYINDYIDLQKMRLTEKTKINISVNGDYKNIIIEPFLFIPFIENAFKHGVSVSDESSIEITFDIKEKLIIFNIRNDKTNKLETSEKSSGLGLKNALRMLNLLYNNTHEIIIKDEPTYFSIFLKLNLYD